jgi:hypothetical protein
MRLGKIEVVELRGRFRVHDWWRDGRATGNGRTLTEAFANAERQLPEQTEFEAVKPREKGTRKHWSYRTENVEGPLPVAAALFDRHWPWADVITMDHDRGRNALRLWFFGKRLRRPLPAKRHHRHG